MTHQTIVVPDIGGAEGAEVVELLVAVGDAIELEQSLIVLESDKASMEIPASHAGVVVELKMAVGDQLSEGDAILTLDTSAADSDGAEVSHREASSNEESSTSADPDDTGSPTADEPAEETATQAISEQIVEVPDIGTDGDVEVVDRGPVEDEGGLLWHEVVVLDLNLDDGEEECLNAAHSRGDEH